MTSTIQSEIESRLGDTEPDVDVLLLQEARGYDWDGQARLFDLEDQLHNVAKHSRASNFAVRLEVTPGKVTLQVEDDGTGFSRRTAHTRGFGLTGMRERAAALGGSMKIRSERGKGTSIQIQLPLAKTAAKANAAAALRHAS